MALLNYITCLTLLRYATLNKTVQEKVSKYKIGLACNNKVNGKRKFNSKLEAKYPQSCKADSLTVSLHRELTMYITLLVVIN